MRTARTALVFLALGAWIGAWACARACACASAARGTPVPFARATAEWDGFYDAWEST